MVLLIGSETIHRTCFEMCKVMANNDERIFYGKYVNWQKEGLPGKVKFSRPVYEIENLQGAIKAQLDTTQPIAATEEKVDQITHALDAIYRIAQEIEISKLIYGKEVTPSHSLAQIIASNYYDCLSGGMSHLTYLLLVELSKHPSVNKAQKVYPNGDGEQEWSNLEDFIATAKATDKEELKFVTKALALSNTHNPKLLPFT